MTISEMADDSIVAFGELDHNSKLYIFSHFIPKSNYISLLNHAHEGKKIKKSNEKVEEGPLHVF